MPTLRRRRRWADAEQDQTEHVERLFAESDGPRAKRVLLRGWEQFDEPVDRIVSIGAFEHFGHDRYDAYSSMARQALPNDGIMLLHNITGLHPDEMAARGMPQAESLEANRDKVIEVQSVGMYDRYMTHLTGRADMFRVGYTHANQFTCET